MNELVLRRDEALINCSFKKGQFLYIPLILFIAFQTFKHEFLSWLAIVTGTAVFINLNIIPLPWSLIFPLLVWVAYTDAKYMVVPNTVPLLLIIAGVYLNGAGAFPSLIFCFLTLLPFVGGIGMGDIKLYAALGAVLGSLAVLKMFFYTTIFALVYIFITMAIRRNVKGWLRNSYFYLFTMGRVKNKNPEDLNELRKVAIPLGSFFLPGALVMFIISYR